MVTNMTYVVSSGVIKLHILDNFLTFLREKKMKDRKVYSLITRKNYKHYNAGSFCDALEGHWQWADFWKPMKSPDKLWSVMLNFF